jgi:hypothetical protein
LSDSFGWPVKLETSQTKNVMLGSILVFLEI